MPWLLSICWCACAATGSLAATPDWLADVSTFAVDPATGEVWAGTFRHGLLRCSGGRCDQFGQLNSGLAGNVVFAVSAEGGRVWAATNGGLSVFDSRSGDWQTHFARRAGGTQLTFTDLQVGDGGVRALGTDGSVYCLGAADAAPVICGKIEGPVPTTPARIEPVGDCTTFGDEALTPAIGLLVPVNRTIALPAAHVARDRSGLRPDMPAVELAIERRARRSGREIGMIIPAPGYSGYAWGLPEDELVKFAWRPGVTGIIAHADRGDAITRLIIGRLGVPVVNTAGPSGENNENPWLFSCNGDEPKRCARLLDYLYDDLGLKKVVAIRTPGREAASHIDWWADHAARHGQAISTHVWESDGELTPLLAKLKLEEPDGILTWCDGPRATELLRGMQAQGIDAWLVGSATLRDSVPSNLEHRRMKLLAMVDEPLTPQGGDMDDFVQAYAQRSLDKRNRRPDARAYRSFLAADHLASAIERSGGDRHRLQQELMRMEREVAGEAHFDDLVHQGSTRIARLVGGSWEVLQLAD